MGSAGCGLGALGEGWELGVKEGVRGRGGMELWDVGWGCGGWAGGAAWECGMQVQDGTWGVRGGDRRCRLGVQDVGWGCQEQDGSWGCRIGV